MPASEKPLLLLIHPYTGFWDSYRSAPSLPLNLLHAASLLTGAFDVSIVDLRVTRDWRAALRDALARNPCLAGLTMMTGPSVESSIEIMKYIKGRSSVPVVCGGPHATMVPDTTLDHPLVDYVVTGAGETAIADLAAALAWGQPLENPQILHENKSAPPARAPLFDIESAPDLPYHLINPRDYHQTFDGVKRFLSMETSRGCNRGCAHCYNSADRAGPWRAQSPSRVFERLKRLKNELGANAVYFVDDNFFMNVPRALEIADAVMRLGMKWQVQGIDLQTLGAMDDATLRHLADTGLLRVNIGIESGSDRVRAMIRKKPSANEVLDIVRRMRKFPFIVYCSFIVNFPGETADDVKKTVRLIRALCDANPRFRNSPVYQYVPFPGTLIAESAQRNGFPKPQRLEDWGRISYERGCGVDHPGLGAGFYRALYFLTLFNDRKSNEYLSDPALRALSRAYQPIARFRLKHELFQLTPEILAYEMINARRGNKARSSR